MTLRSSDPRVAYPEVKVQVRDLVRVVGIVARLSRGVGEPVPGEHSFYRAPGVSVCAGCPQQRVRSKATFREGTVWGL